MSATDAEAREFAQAFGRFLHWVQSGAATSDGREVHDHVVAHLGHDGARRSVVHRELPVLDHVNLQVALDAWADEPGRTVGVHGIGLPHMYGRVTLAQLVGGVGLPPLRLGRPDLVDLPSGPHRTLACYSLALLLVHDDAGSYALLVSGPQPHEEATLMVEVAGLEVAEAQHVLDRLTGLMQERNLYRGQVLELSQGHRGQPVLRFLDRPTTTRAEVVLPEAGLRRIERHTVGVAAHREALQAAGQHLKRGLLLYGPPGTGKTHTTGYVVGRLPDHTVLQLSGRALHAIGTVATLARDLSPAVVVLEDVDLVAHDRDFDGTNPVLFELLDAMDGAAPDADLLFLLTTNRADVLERALADRPGRVDVAVEIARPDDDGRRRLLRLYGAHAPLDLREDEVEEVVARTAGTTASFFKELVRRAVVERLDDPARPPAVTAAHVRRALDDLLDSSQAVTRALLGASRDRHIDPAPDDGDR